MNEPVPQDLPPDPFGPMPPPQDAGQIPRPKAVDNAFNAVLTSVAISVLGTVFTVLLDGALLTRMVTDMLVGVPNAPKDIAETVTVFRYMFAFSLAVFAGLFVLFAWKMRAGRNWARLLLTIYTAVGAVSFLTGMASAGAELERMWSLAEVAFGVTAVVYMFRPESTAYFAEHKRRRQQRPRLP